ncbi:hypothetical protein ACFCV9_38035, partial [Streptomyces sp. NPDC056367]|uniref:hypothetical protein n=1 Tax=Streptomyces sp. NPDC056367 TaxID=3345797 RepID=UPI0035DB7441
APLTALLVVQVTLYSTLTTGVRRVNSVVAGVHAHVDPGTVPVAVARDRHVAVQGAERRHQTGPGEVLPSGHRASSRVPQQM